MPSDVARGPSIDFEWELAVFRGARSLVRALTRDERTAWDPARAAVLEDRARSLAVIAQAIAGEPIRIRPSPGVGGVVGRTLRLPVAIDALESPEENARIYVLRAALAGALLHAAGEVPSDRVARAEREAEVVIAAATRLAEELGAFGPAFGRACAALAAKRPSLASFRGEERAIEAARVEALRRGAALADLELPEPIATKTSWWSRPSASEPVVLFGELLRVEDFPEDAAAPAEEGDKPSITTEIDAPPVDRIELVTLNQKELEDAVLTHTFEKIDTADEHRGGARDLDGEDELDDHLEALEEVPLGKVIRDGENVRSMLRADIGLDLDVPDVATIAPGERGVPYDEWDRKARRYRKDWCTVYPTPVPKGDGAWAREAIGRRRTVIRDLVRAIEVHRSRAVRERRRRDGDDVDLDAVVRHLAAMRAGEEGDPALYVRRARAARDVATTVLLDVSLSSDAWVDDRRVLDVSREATLVLGEVAEKLGDHLQVLGFASHTRNRCRVFEVRKPTEPWSLGRARLGALRPMGYTRIGPALRHAIAETRALPARRRVVLLISDGKPTDYDRYEGRHGIEDVRQAVREAARDGIWVHGLTVDVRANESFPAMLGHGHFSVLRRVDDLPRTLGEVWGRLSR